MIGTFIMDVILLALLGATVFYCIKLNKSLQVVRNSKSEMEALLKRFTDSTDQAHASLQEMKEHSAKIIQELQSKIDKGNFLADDLAFLMEKGNKVADNLESGVTTARKGDSSPNRKVAAAQDILSQSPAPAKMTPNPSAGRTASRDEDTRKDISKSEQELIEALKMIR